MNGFEGGKSDGLVLDRVRAERNNREHFNPAPVSAGIKMHTSRGVLITDSVFSNNYANGIWFDVSNYDVKLINNDVIGNTDDGVIWELSEKLLMVNNRLIDNARPGPLLPRRRTGGDLEQHDHRQRRSRSACTTPTATPPT